MVRLSPYQTTGDGLRGHLSTLTGEDKLLDDG